MVSRYKLERKELWPHCPFVYHERQENHENPLFRIVSNSAKIQTRYLFTSRALLLHQLAQLVNSPLMIINLL